MPLPTEPTQRPREPKARTDKAEKANKDLMLKAIFCILIGLGVLVSPYFIRSPGMQDIVARSSLVGWFALVLGIGFGITWLRRRIGAAKRAS